MFHVWGGFLPRASTCMTVAPCSHDLPRRAVGPTRAENDGQNPSTVFAFTHDGGSLLVNSSGRSPGLEPLRFSDSKPKTFRKENVLGLCVFALYQGTTLVVP
jgi:hypothetical protein